MTKKLKIAKLSQPQAMKDDAHVDKQVVQRKFCYLSYVYYFNLLLISFDELWLNLETPKSKGTQQERVQKVCGDLDKDAITKKFKKAKLSQPQAMKDDERGDEEVVQRKFCYLSYVYYFWWFSSEMSTPLYCFFMLFMLYCFWRFVDCSIYAVFFLSVLVKPQGR